MVSRRAKVVVGALVAGVGIVAALGIGGLVLGNISKPPPREVVQPSVPLAPPSVGPGVEGAPQVSAVVRTGTFVDGDAIHRGSGTVSIVREGEQILLVFADDVTITPGPDLLVYLSANPAGEELGEFVSLGGLISDTGAQAYVVPENIDDYSTVVIWCRAFAVAFATAELD